MKGSERLIQSTRAFSELMRAEPQNVDLRVAKIEVTLQQLANVLVLTARQDDRLNAIERRVDRLEHPPRQGFLDRK